MIAYGMAKAAVNYFTKTVAQGEVLNHIYSRDFL